MSYEFFYPGTPYSLEPGYGELYTGYRVPMSEIGAPTSIQTANQIQEVGNLLNQGGKFFELQPISPEVFEAIPKQHFKEINRLTKLTNAETSIHAPMIDPAGFSKEGWSEVGREEAERQLKGIVEKSHELSPDGNIPVTIHASAIPGTEYSKPGKEMIEQYKKQFTNDYERHYQRAPSSDEMNMALKQLEESQVIAINQETGQLVPLKREEKFYPETGKVIRIPEQEIDTVNNTEWINGITQLAFYKKEADEILTPAYAKVAGILAKGKMPTEEEVKENRGAFSNLQRADLFLDNVETSFRAMYSKAYKFGDEEAKKKLDEISQMWKDNRSEMAKEKNYFNAIIAKSNLIDNTLSKLKELEHSAPQVYKKVEDFAADKAAETLGSTAFNAYKQYGNKAPIISIENLYSGMAFSRSDELKKLVEETRKKFIEKAVKQGISSSDAEQASKKLIGVTWDVGHLNMLRKAGFTTEEIVKESAKIAPYVKHAHITDNFGFADAHLPPGMGNVPIKDILKELEAAGFKGKKIIEAGGFVQHFKQSPSQYVLEAFGSPLYPMMAQPYWNQMAGTAGNYFSFPSAYMPEQHFALYGGGFSNLPVELGGQMPGKQSRVSGTPMD